MKQPFKCYLCEDDKPDKEKGIEVGSGFFLYHICKQCSRKNYSVYGAFENLNDDDPIVRKADWVAESNSFIKSINKILGRKSR